MKYLNHFCIGNKVPIDIGGGGGGATDFAQQTGGKIGKKNLKL